MSDHVHMYLSVPPKHSPSYVMKILKGKSAEQLRKRHGKDIKVKSVWARGYFVSIVGINSETVRLYVKNQIEEEERERQLSLWRDS